MRELQRRLLSNGREMQEILKWLVEDLATVDCAEALTYVDSLDSHVALIRSLVLAHYEEEDSHEKGKA